MHSKVDPAALLVAVFAVALGALVEPGVWDVLHTYTAAIVGLVVICFTWPRTDDEGRAPTFDRRIVIAQTVVYGYILGVALCWPVQSLLSDCWLLRTDVTCELASNATLHATFIAFGVGVLSIFGFYLLVRWKIKRLLKPPPKPARAPRSGDGGRAGSGLGQAPSDVQRPGIRGSTGTAPDKRGYPQEHVATPTSLPTVT